MHSVPENVSHLAEKQNEEVPLANIGLLWDSYIQHVHITNYQDQSYYGDYFMTTSYSKVMQDLQLDQAVKLFRLVKERVGGGDLTLVEVGCGDGSFLVHASKYFDNVIGIEPSKTFANAAESKGFKIINDYVTNENNLGVENFSSFASRQVFEHLPDPLNCLLGIKRLLKPGAVGIIEVPNGYKAFRKGNFFEFFPDHVNYYSVNSLVALATAAGFNVISCNESFGGDYLELWVSFDLNQENWVNKMNDMKKSTHRNITDWVNNDLNKSRAIFGCGAKTLSIIVEDSLFFSKHFKYIIDSDPTKQGKFVPNTPLKIVAPNEIEGSDLDSILILALSYKEEIANSLRKQLGSNKKLFTLDLDGSIVTI
jgi:SAM-dependent methyltransferase